MERRPQVVIVLSILLACWPCAFALNPSLDISQYAHRAWKTGEGLPIGAIRAITQTPDGYLWLGTEFGLLRFDGVRAVPWEPPSGEHLPTSDIRSLRGARDGGLWIGTFLGLASWKDGKLTHYPELDGQVIEALLEDHEGTIWVAGWAPTRGRLCKFQSGKMQCYGEDGRFGYGVTPLYEDSAGNLWAGAMNGLWRWKPGPPKLYPMPDAAERIYALVESDDGGILIGRRTGILKLKNGKTEAFPIAAGPGFQPYRLHRDRDGGLWIGAVIDRGLLHIHDGRADVFSRPDGLTGESVSAFLEDREGNICVATTDGLDCFRDFAIPAISRRQGLSSQGVSSIVAARDGSLWLGASDGINRWNKGQITIYRRRSRLGVEPIGAHSTRTVREITDNGVPDENAEHMFEDNEGEIWIGTRKGVAIFKSGRFFPVASVPYGIVYSITEDHAGNIWMSHQQGLLHLIQTRVVERIAWTELGRREPATASLQDAREGGLWLGFRDGGVAYFKDNQLRASYGRTEGLGEGLVRSIYQDGSGSLWVATEGGLSRIKDGRVLTLNSQNGLPCNTVHWMMDDDANSAWLYTACGLVRIDRSELDAWTSYPKQTIKAEVFDSSDGVSSHRFAGGYNANVAKSADGKLWFTRVGGVSVLDPHHLPVNKIPPPVHIEQVVADDKTYDAKNDLHLPARVRNVAIDYTALSLVAPEKVRFRYKLEGQNQSWHEVVNDRKVQYTNLAPGNYRFRVLACNNSGVWNEQGDALDFVIPPAWYQTSWFFSLCAAAFLALLWALHHARVHYLARQFSRTLETRVGERTRIARELHDTLLQSFHGLLLRFQSALQLLPDRPLDAKQRLESAIDQAAEAITEARDAVQDLRASTVTTNELALSLKTLGEELSLNAANPTSPHFRVEVFGAARDLHPIVRDEVYRVAAEALRNAFVHAHATRIEMEIRYDPHELLVAVRDDGKGIDAEILADEGRTGHYGLPGIRERAKLVGGKLEVWTDFNAGTEIQLKIPAANAYTNVSQRGSWLQRFSRKGKKEEINIGS